MSDISLPTSTPSTKIGRGPRRRFASLRAIAALMLREMATTYGRSPGGYVWAVLEPVAGIALLTLVFSAAFRSPSLGSNFPIFYATGLVPFVLYNSVQNKVAQSLHFSRPLLAYPNVTFLDAIFGRFSLNIMTEILVGYIVFIGILLAFDTRLSPDLTAIVQIYALVALLALSTGVLNCYMTTRFPVWQQAWSILMRPMFILSCIFFLFEDIPQPYQDWLWYNPLVHITGGMRDAFYLTYDAPYVSPLYVVTVSLICLATGLVFLRRYHRDLLQN